MALSKIQSGLLDTNSVDATALSSSAIASGDLPTGTVLQVKDFQNNQTYFTGGHGGSYQDIWTTSTITGGQYPNITPKSSSSRLIITWWHQCLIDGDDARLNCKLYKSETAGSGWTEIAASGGYYFGNDTSTDFSRQQAALSATHTTTSGTTNTLYFTLTANCNNNIRPWYWHIGGSSMSKITITEVAA